KPGRHLDELTLTNWLSEKSNIPLFHIDPMKVPVAEAAEIMSYQFAKRHGLLCVGVNREAVTVAVTQPWMSDWESQLAQTVRQVIKTVVCVPSDIEKYRIEFYSLASSVSRAESGGGRVSGVGNFEQLLELG